MCRIPGALSTFHVQGNGTVFVCALKPFSQQYVLDCCCLTCTIRAKKLHEDRQSEMQQTLTKMNDRTEALDRLATQKEAASAAKADAESKLKV